MTHALAHLPITEIEPKVRAAISRTQGDEPIVKPVNEPLGFDSLTAIEIRLELEDEFDLEISDDDMEKAAASGDFDENTIAGWIWLVSDQLKK
jgi:acyl carrier protein